MDKQYYCNWQITILLAARLQGEVETKVAKIPY